MKVTSALFIFSIFVGFLRLIFLKEINLTGGCPRISTKGPRLRRICIGLVRGFVLHSAGSLEHLVARFIYRFRFESKILTGLFLCAIELF